ncbi:hypothetical protein J6590_051549 [Homalodisca vitripennis]|nr:hypothetical protein J6590_051549 [Homalodisca vitripennis]
MQECYYWSCWFSTQLIQTDTVLLCIPNEWTGDHYSTQSGGEGGPLVDLGGLIDLVQSGRVPVPSGPVVND